MSFSKTFIDRPIATALIMAALLLVGALAFAQLTVSALPKIEFPTISVGAQLPGADPEIMASSVATPLERQFAQIADLTQMTSTSTLGNTSISLQFNLGRNIDGAAEDVSSAINAAAGQLPRNLPNPPSYRKVNQAEQSILVLGAYSDVLPIDQVDDYVDNILVQQFSQVSGVGQVSINGEQKPAVRVQIDPAASANQGISLEDIRTVLGQTTVNAPKGFFNGPALSSTIASNDQLRTAAEYNRIVVAYRHGAPVHISDIGAAVDSVENNQIAAWADSHRGFVLSIFRQPGANIIDTVKLIKAEMPRLLSTLPPSLKIDILSDKTQVIRSSVTAIEETLMIAVALVVLVIFLFLRKIWATVIPGIAVPLSLVGTFGVMYLLDYSLNNISLMALTIAVGFVVDDAIVMIENIVRYIEQGESPYRAAVKGAGQVGFTIVSITFSLIAVFIPLLLMSGIVGRLFHQFAVTVSVAVLISAFVSLTLTPTMCARFLGHEEEHHGRFYILAERFFDWMVNGYARLLRIVLRHQFLTLMSLLATIALTGVMFATMPKGFFPQQDTGTIQATTQGAQSISFDAMMARQKHVLDLILQDPGVGHVGAYMGSGGGNLTNTGRMPIFLKEFTDRKDTAEQIINRLRPRLSNLEGVDVHLQNLQDITIGARTARTQFQYTLQDQNLDELNYWSGVMFGKLKTIRAIQDVATDQQSAGPRTVVKVDRETASRLGVLSQQIDDTLYDAFGQRQVNTIFTQLNQYHVILEVDPKYQIGPEVLSKVYVKSLSGQLVPLSAFTSIGTATAPLVISHQGQFPAVTLSFNLAAGASLGEAVEQVQQAAAEVRMPISVVPTFQGNAQAFQASLVTMPYLIAAAIVAVYIVLGILYESFIHPLTILSTIPSAGVGALLTLRLFGYELDMMGLIGIILLIGIVKKNAIMMIDFAIETERHQNMAPEDAIYHAALLRYRPIMMTTMAALFSGFPLMLSASAGAEFRRPLGFAIVGGLLLSQVLTLFTTPVVYLYLDRLGVWLRGAHKKSGAQSSVSAGGPVVSLHGPAE